MNFFKKIHLDERGTTMTEFVVTLPIFITMMIGIINFGQLGMAANAVELTAQKNLWDEVIPITDGLDAVHMFPIAAGVAEQSNIPDLNVAGNNQRYIDDAELVLHGLGLELGGHWGESYQRLVVFSFIVDELDDLTGQPKDILGEQSERPFPHMLLNDSIQQDWGSVGSIEGLLTSVVSASGAVPSVLAGIRYGVVFVEASRSEDLLVTSTTLNAGAHFDTLVAPSPIRTRVGTDVGTFGGAFLLAQTIDDPYRKMQRYGKSEWDGEEGSVPDGYLPDADGELDDALEDCQDQYEDKQEECDDQEDDLEDGEVLSQECQDLRSNPNPCQGP